LTPNHAKAISLVVQFAGLALCYAGSSETAGAWRVGTVTRIAPRVAFPVALKSHRNLGLRIIWVCGVIADAGKENDVNLNNYKFAASAALQSKTDKFAHRTRFEARPHRACPKMLL
jgi:hypothetical protein